MPLLEQARKTKRWVVERSFAWLILPITTGGGFAVPISGIKTTGVVRCDQPRTLDMAARNGHKVDTLPPAIMDEVLAAAATLFQ